MVKTYVVATWWDVKGRRRTVALLMWGGQEQLNPRDVGMQQITAMQLTPQNITPTQQPVAIGSIPTLLGTPDLLGHIRGGGPGSTVTLRWAMGSTGTRLATTKAFGTMSSGTKSAWAEIIGADTW